MKEALNAYARVMSGERDVTGLEWTRDAGGSMLVMVGGSKLLLPASYLAHLEVKQAVGGEGHLWLLPCGNGVAWRRIA